MVAEQKLKIRYHAFESIKSQSEKCIQKRPKRSTNQQFSILGIQGIIKKYLKFQSLLTPNDTTMHTKKRG